MQRETFPERPHPGVHEAGTLDHRAAGAAAVRLLPACRKDMGHTTTGDQCETATNTDQREARICLLDFAMTDTNGLLRDAGGPRPKDDLVERLMSEANDIEGYPGEVMRKAAARLLEHGQVEAQLEHEVARLSKLEAECWTSLEAWMVWCDIRVLERERAEKAEAERDGCREELVLLQKDSVSIFEWLNRKGGLGLDVHRRIDTFLATWSKP